MIRMPLLVIRLNLFWICVWISEVRIVGCVCLIEGSQEFPIEQLTTVKVTISFALEWNYQLEPSFSWLDL